MYIEKIIVKNFRIFGSNDNVFKFTKGLNVILGPNNAGKTALIDALRIAFSTCDYHKEIYFTLDDFHVDQLGNRACESYISIFFDEVEDKMFEIYDVKNENKGEFHIKFYIEHSKNGLEKVKYKIWGGESEANTITSDFFDENFNLSYLNALRNVESDFSPSKNSKISALIKGLYTDDNDKDELIGRIRNLNEELIEQDKIKLAKQIINNNIEQIEGERFHQNIDFEFVEPKFDNILASIKGKISSKWVYIPKEKNADILKCPDITKFIKKMDSDIFLDLENAEKNGCFASNGILLNILKKERKNSFNLSQNGLGYNNIIYISSVLGDMEHLQESEIFNIFLIEEPEAHLHPQLQRLLQLFLERKAANKNIQIFYTTHSPSLSSSCKLESLNMISSQNGIIKISNIVSTRLENNSKEYDYIEHFLDVTKSQMLFSKGIIFVEGVSEALLISKMANLLNISLSASQIEIVNINGVAFGPFINLITYKNGTSFIPAVVITDDDRCSEKNEFYIDESIDYNCSNIDIIIEQLKASKQSSRCDALDKLISGTEIKVKKAFKTLEYEIAIYNPEIALNAIKEIHPRIASSIDTICKGETTEKKATRIWLALKNRGESKSLFAKKILEEMSKNPSNFKVPPYIEKAIRELDGILKNES